MLQALSSNRKLSAPVGSGWRVKRELLTSPIPEEEKGLNFLITIKQGNPKSLKFNYWLSKTTGQDPHERLRGQAEKARKICARQASELVEATDLKL